MTECMAFPDDWHEFLNDYSFKDEEEIYTNGSRLIQVFRVEQLIEHLESQKYPRKYAYWIEEPDRSYHWHCSNCKTVQDITSVIMKYCPECGCVMGRHPLIFSQGKDE